MNFALWLERAGMSHGPRPAVGLGDRAWCATTRTLPDVSHDLPARCVKRFKLQPGDRVAIAAHNSIDYLDVLYAIWHAGLAAVPANAKLHGAELGYILEHSQARVCFASSDLEAAIAAHAPPTLERLVTIGGADYAALFQADATAITPQQPDDLAWLFYTSGTTGRPKGAMLTHRVLVLGEPRLCRRGRPDRPRRRDPARRADEPWLRALHHGAYCAAGDQRGAGIRRLRSGGDLPAFTRWQRRIDVRRADDGPAPARLRRRLRSPAYPHADLGRRAMYVEDTLEALQRFGPRLAQIYGQGESPDDDLHAVEARHRRPRASALAGAARLGRPARLPAST